MADEPEQTNSNSHPQPKATPTAPEKGKKRQNTPKKDKEVKYNFSGKNKAVMLKKRFINAFLEADGNVSYACKQVGLHRSAFYRWQENDPEFKRACEELQEEVIDSVESHLRGLIKNGDTAATIFFLKTKGKSRGYIETRRNENVNQNYDFSNPPGITMNLTSDPKYDKEKEGKAKLSPQAHPPGTEEVRTVPKQESANNPPQEATK